jgi:type I restriction enzyme S subunit
MGADGVKVLRPKIDADIKYLYHYLRQLRLTEGGYDRHFKYLKRSTIVLPPLPEQRRIAEILDKADTLRIKRCAALKKLDELNQSIFLVMFGNSAQREFTIGELLDQGALLLHKDGNHGSSYPRAEDFSEVGVPFLSARCITGDGLIDNSLIEMLRVDKAEKLRIGWISKSDVLLAHNASVGKVALYDGRFDRALIGTSLTAFRTNPEVLNSNFLTAALRSSEFQRQLEKNMGQTTRNQVPITAQRGLRVPLPPIELQSEFAFQVSAVEKLKTENKSSLVKFDVFIASLQQHAFRGGL